MLGENKIDSKILIAGAVLVAIVFVAIVVLLVLPAVSGGGEDKNTPTTNNQGTGVDYCGDGICNGTETEVICPEDCSVKDDISVPSGNEEGVIPEFP